MKIAVYRNAEGEIKRFHSLYDFTENHTEQELEESIINYNNNNSGGLMVEAIDLKENSVELYLYEKAMKNIKANKEQVRDMVEYLSDAISMIEALEE